MVMLWVTLWMIIYETNMHIKKKKDSPWIFDENKLLNF